MRRCAGRKNWVDTTKVNVTLKGQVLESLHFVSITAAMFFQISRQKLSPL
jgi:hypothetical protein